MPTTPLFTDHSQDEMNLIVLRFRSEDALGLNYNVVGDVANGAFAAGQSGNKSPGDAARIKKDASDFMINPSAELTNPATFKLGYEYEPQTFRRCMNAAFLAAVMTRGAAISKPVTFSYTAAQLKTQCRTILMQQIARTETDHSKYTYFKDGAGWRLSGFLMKMLSTYDYIKDILTTNDKLLLNTFFNNAARFHAINVHLSMDELWPLRLENNYKPASKAATLELPLNVREGRIDKEYPYTHVNADGTLSGQRLALHNYYNNRRAKPKEFCGYWDAFCKNNGIPVPIIEVVVSSTKTYKNTLREHVKLYFKEFIKYGINPDGMGGEFGRGVPPDPNKGMCYWADNLECAANTAERYARQYDFELADYTTPDGIGISKGTPNKGLKMAIETYCKMCNGQINRYYGSVTVNNRYGNVQIKSGVTWNYANDIRFAKINLYYKSDIIAKTYKRDPTVYNVSYPTSNLGGIASALVYTGGEGYSPGILLCYGGLENRVDPYSQAKIKQEITFNALPNKVFGDGAFPIIAKAGSGLQVEFTVEGPGVLAGNVLTINGAGTITLTATQAGDGTYEVAAPVQRTLIVEKANQTVTLDAIADKQVSVSPPFLLAGSASSGLALSYDIISGSGDLVDGLFTPNGVGTVVVMARQAGNENYKEASATRTFSVAPAPPPPTTNVMLNKIGTETHNGMSTSMGLYTNGIKDNLIQPTEYYLTFSAAQLEGKTANKILVRFFNPIPFKVQYKVGANWVDWVSAVDNTQTEVTFVVPDRVMNTDVRFVGLFKTPNRNLEEFEIQAY